MSPLGIAAVAAALVASAIGCVVHGIRVQRPSIAQVRAILLPGNMTASGSSTSPVLRWIERHLDGNEAGGATATGGSTPLAADSATLASRCVAAFAIGTFTVVLSVSAMIAIGALPLSPAWLVLAVGTGGAAAWVMLSDARTKLAGRRREFRPAPE
ncbi:MAG: hypothetical protein AAB131_01615 [Actinomycetota bacterium]|mgnify:FL=1